MTISIDCFNFVDLFSKIYFNLTKKLPKIKISKNSKYTTEQKSLELCYHSQKNSIAMWKSIL